MSIGLISENKIREKLRKQIEEDMEKFLANGGVIEKLSSHGARSSNHNRQTPFTIKPRTEST